MWTEMLGRMDGRKQGRLEGTTDAVIRVLQARGLGEPDYLFRWVIDKCVDLSAANELLSRAAIVERLEDLYADEV